MTLTAEQLLLKKELIKELDQKLVESGQVHSPALIAEIAENFLIAYIQFKEQISTAAMAQKKIHGEIIWSEERSAIIDQFAEKLDTIFAPIGGLNPGEASAYWSGLGVKRAEEFGIDFAKTIPGYVINRVSHQLKSTLTKNAYTPDDAIDTSTDAGLWEAMSALYAKGTIADANIFLVDGVTSQYSILWNTELQALREGQMTDKIKDIWLHTLKPEYLTDYKMLLDYKKLATTDDERLKLDQSIATLLKNTDHWQKEKIDESSLLKLKTSGFTGALKTVDFQNLKNIAQSWIKTTKTLKEIRKLDENLMKLQLNLLKNPAAIREILDLKAHIENLQRTEPKKIVQKKLSELMLKIDQILTQRHEHDVAASSRPPVAASSRPPVAASSRPPVAARRPSLADIVNITVLQKNEAASTAPHVQLIATPATSTMRIATHLPGVSAGINPKPYLPAVSKAYLPQGTPAKFSPTSVINPLDSPTIAPIISKAYLPQGTPAKFSPTPVSYPLDSRAVPPIISKAYLPRSTPTTFSPTSVINPLDSPTLVQSSLAKRGLFSPPSSVTQSPSPAAKMTQKYRQRVSLQPLKTVQDETKTDISQGIQGRSISKKSPEDGTIPSIKRR